MDESQKSNLVSVVKYMFKYREIEQEIVKYLTSRIVTTMMFLFFSDSVMFLVGAAMEMEIYGSS